MIFNINSTRGQNAGPHVRNTGNLSSIYKVKKVTWLVSYFDFCSSFSLVRFRHPITQLCIVHIFESVHRKEQLATRINMIQ